MSDTENSTAQLRFSARNLVLIGLALACLMVGYLLLSSGDTAVAPVLLVLGYCVLFPLGLAL